MDARHKAGHDEWMKKRLMSLAPLSIRAEAHTHMISRRSILGGGAVLLAAPRVLATEIAEKLDAPANEGPVALTRYAAS